MADSNTKRASNSQRDSKVEGINSPDRKKQATSLAPESVDDIYADLNDDDDNLQLEKEKFERNKVRYCVCKTDECKKISMEWTLALGARPFWVKISRDAYREVSCRQFEIEKNTSTQVFIKLIHFKPQDRQSAWKQKKDGDHQFKNDEGKYILPEKSKQHWLEIKEELDMIVALNAIDKNYYESSKNFLFGKEANAPTLSCLRLEYDKRVKQTISEDGMQKLERLTLEAGDYITLEGKKNGSCINPLILKQMLQVESSNKLSLPINNIANDKLLYTYIDFEREKICYNDITTPTTATTILPHSFASRRREARPAVQSKHRAFDYSITVHVDAEILMDTFIPSNQSGAAKKKTVSNVSGYYQGQLFKDKKMERHFNDYDQPVYKDALNQLKYLMPNNLRGWNKADYYRVGDILSLEEVTKCINLAKKTKPEHLAVFLIMVCRAKGKVHRDKCDYTNKKKAMMELLEDEKVIAGLQSFETFMDRLIPIVIKRAITLSPNDLLRLVWITWNPHLTEFDELYDTESKKARKATRDCSIDPSPINKLSHQYLTIMQHTQGIKDEAMLELYCRVGLNIPDNKVALKLFQQHNFYDLYWILCHVFQGFGMNSQRAEIHLSSIVVIETMFGGQVPMDHSLFTIYQCGRKKVNIILNEIIRNNKESGSCIASGNDRHVNQVGKWFNPYDKNTDELFTMLLCHNSKDYIKWLFNEMVGELRQAMRATEGSERNRFGVNCYVDLLSSYPEYSGLVQMMSLPKHWKKVSELLKHKNAE